MPKNTFIVVGILAVFAALVVGVNLGKKFSQIPSTAQTVAPTISPTQESTPTAPRVSSQVFTNSYCGISFDYPVNFTKLESASGSAVLLNPDNAQSSIAVACQKDIPRPALTQENMELATVSGVIATIYHDASAKDGTAIDKLIFLHPKNGLDIFVAGTGTVFDQILSSLNILR